MGSCNLPGKYSERAASKTADELLLIALALGVLILMALCMGFAGSLLLIAAVAVFLGVVQAMLNCEVLNTLHVVLLGFVVFAVFAGIPFTAILVTSGVAYLALYGVSLLLTQIQYDRYALR